MNHHLFAGSAKSSTLKYSDAGKFAFVHRLSTRKVNNSATSLFGRKKKTWNACSLYMIDLFDTCIHCCPLPIAHS